METQAQNTPVFFELIVWALSFKTGKRYKNVRVGKTFEELHQLVRPGLRWQIDATFKNGRRVTFAQSNRFPLVPSVTGHMRAGGKTAIIDGCYTEFKDNLIFVYFKPTVSLFESHIKVYNRESIALVGNVTAENFDGFMAAAEVARQLLDV